jgi:hypothetical protein
MRDKVAFFEKKSEFENDNALKLALLSKKKHFF